VGEALIAFWTEICTVIRVSIASEFSQTMSVSQATSRGVAGLLKDAEHGEAVIVARHGQPVAAVIGMARLQELRALESDLRDAMLILTRAATDPGTRTSLDEAIEAFGFSRADLEAELEADLAAGRD
jgi:prevent-host-death family protein